MRRKRQATSELTGQNLAIALEAIVAAATAAAGLMFKDSQLAVVATAFLAPAVILFKYIFSRYEQSRVEARLKAFDFELRVRLGKRGVEADIRRLVKPIQDQLLQSLPSRKIHEQAEKPPKPRVTAIGAVMAARRKATYAASITLLFSMVSYLAVVRRFHAPVDIVVMVVITVGIVAINASAMAFSYRVSHGLYGTTEYEVREIIRFVLSRCDDVDFSSGLGAREFDATDEIVIALETAWAGANT